MGSPIDIPNASQCRVNHGIKKRIRDMELQKKANELWSEYGKNYSRKELNILARAAGIQYFLKYKKHELALKLGIDLPKKKIAGPKKRIFGNGKDEVLQKVSPAHRREI